MNTFEFLLWAWLAASLAFAGDGLIAQGTTRNARDLGRVMYDFSGAMLLCALVDLFVRR